MTGEGAHTLHLPDGRRLAFAQYGDPGGKAVFFFHGTPGSRFFRPPDEITSRLGVRLICVDRPGYGLSSFQSRRRILDWPADIARLADSLHLPTFALAGHSGGGPYALVCAYALPQRACRTALLSSAAPPEAPGRTRGLSTLNRLGMRYARFLVWPLERRLVAWVFRARAADPAGSIARQADHPRTVDERLLGRQEVRQACLESELEAFRPGLTGLAWDIRLITRPWGFPAAGVQVPVHVWHGTADQQTSASLADYLPAQIPDCQATLCAGEGHLLLFQHWKEILAWLCPD
jgi:pimeloyl-ACP methyl ester carboxylesterase